MGDCIEDSRENSIQDPIEDSKEDSMDDPMADSIRRIPEGSHGRFH